MAKFREWLQKRMSRPAPVPETEDPLIAQIREVRGQLEGVYTYFSLENDEDLLDAAIYQREALQARYRYLLRQAREKNAVAEQLPIEAEPRERWIN